MMPEKMPTLEERAREFFMKLMGPQLEVLEIIAPSPLPSIIDAFVAWLMREIERERPRIPATPISLPLRDANWRKWRTCITDTAKTWAKANNVSYTSDLDAMGKMAKWKAR